jgi:predicted nucleotidyltransferase
MDLIRKHRIKISELCRKYKVTELYVFGSILSSKFNNKSDIDFIVEIISNDPLDYSENYFNLKFDLEKLLKRKIDLLEKKSIKNKTFKHLVNKQKKLVYDRQGESVA